MGKGINTKNANVGGEITDKIQLAYPVILPTVSYMREDNNKYYQSFSKKCITEIKGNIPGSVYTRWGRTTCPPGLSDAVYTGIAGGQLYSHSGGGGNYLCLPKDPLWANFTPAVEAGASIYGSEYQMATYSTPIFSDVNAKSLHSGDVPCTVCQTKAPSTIFMLPGRNRCYSGWTLEYSGYLITERYDNPGRTEYVCIDKAPEVVPSSYRDDRGALFHPVQAMCGSLPCPPYVNGRELTCAVCSKRQRTIRYKLQRQGVV